MPAGLQLRQIRWNMEWRLYAVPQRTRRLLSHLGAALRRYRHGDWAYRCYAARQKISLWNGNFYPADCRNRKNNRLSIRQRCWKRCVGSYHLWSYPCGYRYLRRPESGRTVQCRRRICAPPYYQTGCPSRQKTRYRRYVFSDSCEGCHWTIQGCVSRVKRKRSGYHCRTWSRRKALPRNAQKRWGGIRKDEAEPVKEC